MSFKAKQILFIILGLLIIVSGTLVLPYINIQNDIKDIFVSNNSENDRVKSISDKFYNANPPIVLKVTSTSKFDNLNQFKLLNSLAKQLRNKNQLDSVIAITDIKLPKFIETKIVMKPLLNLESSRFKEKYLDQLNQYKDITPLFLSSDRSTATLFLYLKEEFSIDIAKEIKQLAETNGFLQPELIGNTVFENEVKTKVHKDIYRLALIGFILILATFWFFFRSLQVIIFIGWMVGINVNAAILFIWILGMDFNIMTAVIPTIIAILSITDLNHILHIYKKNEIIKSKLDRLKKSYSTIRYSLILTSVTTALGFSIFLLNDVSQIINFGVIAILSISFALITAWYFAPYYITLLNTDKAKLVAVIQIQNLLSKMIQNHHKMVSFVFLILFSASFLSAIYRWDINYIVYDDLENDSSLENSYKNFNSDFIGTRQLELYLTGSELKPFDPKIISLIDSIENLLINEFNYKFINSSNSLLKSYNRSYNRGNNQFYNLAINDTEDAWNSIAENIPKTVTLSLIDSNSTAIKITAFSSEVMSSKGIVEIDAISSRINSILPKKINLDIGGIASMRDHSTHKISTTIIYGIFVSIALISIIMAINFKNFWIGIISLLVNLFPVFASTTLLFWFGLHITPAIAMMLSISFGIALDDTIYFLGRLKSENNGLTQQSIIKNVVNITFPVISTSIILSMSFCALLFSSFSFNITNALIIICTLIIAMLSDLLVLPALLYSTISKKNQVH